jgi:hypothetical protein
MMPTDNWIWDATVKEVEQFIQRLHDIDYEIKPKDDEGKKLASLLAKTIEVYDKFRFENVLRKSASIDAKATIDRAFAYGIVEAGSGIIRKYEECNEESARLQKQNQELQLEKQKWYEQALSWKQKYEELDKRLQGMFKKKPDDPLVGDVQ